MTAATGLATALDPADTGVTVPTPRRTFDLITGDAAPARHEFQMIKFRSMCVGAEARLATLMAANEGAGPLFKLRPTDHPRRRGPADVLDRRAAAAVHVVGRRRRDDSTQAV